VSEEVVAADVLAEQVAYYRARAPEYDRWFRREGRYDRGVAATARWFAEIDEVSGAFDALPLDGADVLELAPGTGIWTERLAGRVEALTAIDASMEMIGRARTRLGPLARGVDFVQADLFSWRPSRTYDGLVCCFWISHVPAERLDAFLRMAAESLQPGGWVFFLDGRREPTSTASDHVLPDGQVMTRRLDDGRAFRIVKNYWTADELEHRARSAGLNVTVRETATYFQYGVGRAAGHYSRTL
jgi:demethylmenaquinone methyltransferase/2-methoxy-6-polyprenyl-1,4-benzoquinol methylase